MGTSRSRSRTGLYMAAGGASIDPDAKAYFDAMTVQPSTARKLLINTLVKGLKADGLWTKIDWLLLLQSHHEQAARLNLRNPAKIATASGTPSFSANWGYCGNSQIGGYLSIGEVYNATGNVYSLNSAFLATWCDYAYSGTTYTIGSGSSSRNWIQSSSATSETYRLNSSSTVSVTTAATKAGSRIASRLSSSQSSYYVDGSLVTTSSSTSSSIDTSPGYVMAHSSSATDDRMTAMASGSGLTATEAGNLHSRINTYLAAAKDLALATEDPDVSAYCAAMSVQPDATRRSLFNDLIRGLKSDCVWQRLDWLTLLAAHDEQASRVNLVKPAKALVTSGSPIFAVGRGWRGTGSTSLTFGEVYNASGNGFSLNDAHAMTVLSYGPSGSNTPIMGSTSTGNVRMYASSTGSTESYRITGASTETTTTASTGMKGCRIISRTASNASAAYKDGVSFDTTSTASSSIPASNAAILQFGSNYTTSTMAAAGFGRGLIAAEAAALSSRVNTYVAAVAASATLDPDTSAYLAAMSVQPSTERAWMIDDFITGLKADGLWSKLDCLMVFAAHDAQAGRINIVNPTLVATAVNSPTFTTDVGYTGNGTSSYLDIGETFDASGNGYSLNSAFVMSYINNSSSNNGYHLGTVSSDETRLQTVASGSSEQWRVNATLTETYTSTGRPGCRVAVRAASNSVILYKDGSQVDTASDASNAIPAGNVTALRAGSSYATDRMAAMAYGPALTATEVANLTVRVQQYLAMLGAA